MGTMVIQPRNPSGNPSEPKTSSSGNLSSNLNLNSNSSGEHPQKRSRIRTVQRSRNRSLSLPVEKSSSKRLVMGEVRILKRGEDLNFKNKMKKENNDSFMAVPFMSGNGDRDLLSGYRLVSNPAIVFRNRVRVPDLYAGAACYPSPPPSSLPIPIGLVKGGSGEHGNFPGAMDLRRLL